MANVRSPNYPAISLPEAIRRVEMVYKQEQRHPVDKEVIAKEIGYGGLNGGSIAVISALTKYGLLEQAGKGEQLKISTDALDILIHNTGEPERARAIQKVAFIPSLFSELYNAYGMDLPSDHSLRATLIKKGFNQKTVDGVIRIYRDTIEFVNMETEDSNMESLDKEQEVPMQTQITRQVTPNSNNTLRSDLATAPSQEKDVSEYMLTFKAAENVDVRIVFTYKGRITQEAIQKCIKHLELDMDIFPTKASLEHESDHQYQEEEVV